MALPVDLGCGLSSDRCAWCMAYVSWWLGFFCFACKIFFYVLLLKPHSSREIWGMILPDLPNISCLECLFLFCVHRACVAAFDAPMTIFVVAGWVSSWYSWRSHDALVKFIGEAALCKVSSQERLGNSRWWRWLRPSQLVMALIASIAISHVVIDCCCLLQLRLAPTLTLHLQLHFLLVVY